MKACEYGPWWSIMWTNGKVDNHFKTPPIYNIQSSYEIILTINGNHLFSIQCINAFQNPYYLITSFYTAKPTTLRVALGPASIKQLVEYYVTETGNSRFLRYV